MEKPPRFPWLKIATLIISGVALLGLFSSDTSDTDFWWHLKTGEYIAGHRSLPLPDPFAYTTSAAVVDARGNAVRHFNLTHEWLSQLLMYGLYALVGLPGIILTRAAILAGICGLAGLCAARLSRSLYLGLAAAGAAASVLVAFIADRPSLVSFLGVAVFITLLESRRGWWLLPPLSVLWANCHGGFFLGWIVLIAYCVDPSVPNRRRLWLLTACSIVLSGLNPNGFGVISILLDYRRSPMTASLVEWLPPKLWGAPYGFDILLYSGVVVLALAWKRVRIAHWILFLAFAAAALTAFRNIALIGFLAPVLIAAYFPFRFEIPRALEWIPGAIAAAILSAGIAQGRIPQFGAAQWMLPAGAAQFLLDHQITGPLFNTYEQGGYLIWRLWPEPRVFIDGRSLSESVYRDYRQILFNDGAAADQVTGLREQLLNRYGVRVVVMNTIDLQSGALYPLAIALANPATADWDLVYEDVQSVIFLRQSPANLPVLSNKLGRVLKHMNNECIADIENSPGTPLCARTLADFWARNQVRDSARKMMLLYLEHATHEDEQAQRALRQIEAMPGR